MAAPMREELGGAVAASTDSVGSGNGNNNNTSSNANFEYDDNEWDIGIGDLIIDLDADIEKTGSTVSTSTGEALGTNSTATTAGLTAGSGAMSGAAATAPTATTAGSNKATVEHSATVDKGLKMKIKRTKTGTKSFEAKHEIVKSGEQNGSIASTQSQSSGSASSNDSSGSSVESKQTGKHSSISNTNCTNSSTTTTSTVSSVKRGSSSHRRDKTKDKQHNSSTSSDKCHKLNSNLSSELNGRGPVNQSSPRTNFPVISSNTQSANVPGPGPPIGETGISTSNVTNGPDQNLSTPVVVSLENTQTITKSTTTLSTITKPLQSTSPPLINKVKTANSSTSVSLVEQKETSDACVGTSISVGTVTEPDCFGPCEPGTHVNLEGIVWNEIEGVLVVNVTWRGKTYIGTLLDCTRHDWAPPRFSEASAGEPECRLPQKGRGKRGRASLTASPSNDLVNFTETRSSVHSKLRSNGTNKCNNSNNSSRRGTSSPTPTSFVPPRSDSTGSNKRKKPPGSEDEASAKKIKAEPASPPPMSPTMLECPEPNCSKKYKNENGLRYHQSHAHGAALDDEDADTKESGGASTSENEDDTSPVSVSNSGIQENLKEDQSATNQPIEQPQPATTPPVTDLDPPAPLQSPPLLVAKPSVLRFGLSGNEETNGITSSSIAPKTVLSVPIVQPAPTPPPLLQPATHMQTIAPTSQSPQPQPPILHVQSPASQQLSTPPQIQPLALNQPQVQKVPQFKVKPASALMPSEDNMKNNNKDNKIKTPSSSHKKKNRKSPVSSPRSFSVDQPQFDSSSCSREDVHSPAYSDISDDTAPILEVEINDNVNKQKLSASDKKSEPNTAHSPHPIQPYNMYPSYYSQPPYLISSVQPNDTSKQIKESDKVIQHSQDLKTLSSGDKDNKKDVQSNQGEYQQQKMLQQYFTYDAFVQNYPYNMGPGYPMSMVQDKEIKSDDKNHQSSMASSLSIPQPNKIKSDQIVPKEKPSHQNENHQIMKESIEMKSQMNSAYMFSRQQQQQQQHDETRRYYAYPDQRRKDHSSNDHSHTKSNTQSTPTKHSMTTNSMHKHKEKHEDKKDDKMCKNSHLSEGVKPTMETQGPPPPPTSSYSYIHPGFMQSPHFGTLAFDPLYRSALNPMLVPGPYGNTPPPPYLHPQLHAQMQRYHAPEDLSRPAVSTQSSTPSQPPSGPKAALDLLQHHASQYYSSHKIHELQERAIKSPTPKPNASGLTPAPSPGTRQSPSLTSTGIVPSTTERTTSTGPPSSTQPSGKSGSTGDPKDCRSPPPQRHVHTHHHTHVGLGYPLYPAPYTGKPL